MATVELHALRRLSSSLTFFYKRVFPICWFGFIYVFVHALVVLTKRGNVIDWKIFLGPVVMAFVGSFIMKHLLWKNVDEVWDAGEALLVRDRGDEELIRLGDVTNVAWSQWTNPETVTLSLAVSSRFGERVTFMLPTRWVAFGRHPLVAELIERTEQARSNG